MENNIYVRRIDVSTETKVIIFTSTEPAKGITMKHDFLHWVKAYMAKIMPVEPISYYEAVETELLSVTAIIGINELPTFEL